MADSFYRRLIEVEIRLGFLSIPSYGMELMPNDNSKIKVTLDNKDDSLRYNADYRRIFGLTAWYRKHDAKPGDQVFVEKKGESLVFSFGVKAQEKQIKDKEDTLDISGLSSHAKGDIVEDRVKELLLLHGQGLLNVYKPVIDNEGIDLIVVKNGNYNPIFIQVKSRYNLHEDRSLILRIKTKTFKPNVRYYVVGAFFNCQTLELDENILLIPSTDVVKNAGIVKGINGEWYNVVTSLTGKSDAKWGKYIIKKNTLATHLLNKFEEMDKYIK